MPSTYESPYVDRRKQWRYPGVPIPLRLQRKYKE